MGVIYQLTFFLALGLLAIVITIFVFAVSLLGRAMDAAATSERGKLAERKENNAKEMAAIRKEIEEAEASGQIPRGLTRKLKKLEKRDEKFGKELGKIRRAPKLLTVTGGVVPCASWLLGALILTGGAWYLSDIQIFIGAIPVLIWVLGLAAIGYTISHIYQCLRVIESVAITSEEAAFVREAESFKVALREVEEEKKPKLKLIFEDAQPPFHVEAESERFIEFSVHLSSGDIGRKLMVAFLAPPGFEFPDSPTGPRPPDKYANYFSTVIEFEDIRKGIHYIKQVKLKAPSQPEHYTAVYKLMCEGFNSGFEQFEVIVE